MHSDDIRAFIKQWENEARLEVRNRNYGMYMYFIGKISAAELIVGSDPATIACERIPFVQETVTA